LPQSVQQRLQSAFGGSLQLKSPAGKHQHQQPGMTPAINWAQQPAGPSPATEH